MTEPDIHVDGDMAWIAYVDKGNVGDARGSVAQQWLESAVLTKQSGAWKLVSLHSTRVNVPKAGGHDH